MIRNKSWILGEQVEQIIAMNGHHIHKSMMRLGAQPIVNHEINRFKAHYIIMFKAEWAFSTGLLLTHGGPTFQKSYWRYFTITLSL